MGKLSYKLSWENPLAKGQATLPRVGIKGFHCSSEEGGVLVKKKYIYSYERAKVYVCVSTKVCMHVCPGRDNNKLC